MARRKSTIGHDPLEAISLDSPVRPAPAPKAATIDPPPKRKAAPAAKKLVEKPIVAPAEPPAPKPDPQPINGEVLPPIPFAVSREVRAMEIVRSYYGWSTAAVLVPVPLLDFAGVVGVQMKMLKELAKLYETPFEKQRVRSLVVALLSGAGGFALAGPVTSFLKFMPIVGPMAGLVAMPAMATASCWATGRVFIRHFESGGTFLDFDAAKTSAQYAEQLAEAKGKA